MTVEQIEDRLSRLQVRLNINGRAITQEICRMKLLPNNGLIQAEFLQLLQLSSTGEFESDPNIITETQNIKQSKNSSHDIQRIRDHGL